MSINAQTFSPLAVANLEIWYDASDFSTIKPLNISNGNTVSEWRDKSGNGNDATQGTAVDQPTYTENAVNGLPGLLFSGGDQNLATGVNWPIQFECFIVAQHTVFSTFDRLLSSYDGGGALVDGEAIVSNYTSGSSLRLFTFGGSIQSAPMTQVTGTPILYGAYANSSSDTELFYNGVSLGTGITTQTVANKEIHIAEDRIQLSSSGVKYISEIVFFSSALSSINRDRIVQYLSNKWGFVIGSVPII